MPHTASPLCSLSSLRNPALAPHFFANPKMRDAPSHYVPFRDFASPRPKIFFQKNLSSLSLHSLVLPSLHFFCLQPLFFTLVHTSRNNTMSNFSPRSLVLSCPHFCCLHPFFFTLAHTSQIIFGTFFGHGVGQLWDICRLWVWVTLGHMGLG